jgi:hypothetical protein
VFPDPFDDNIVWASSSNNVTHMDMRTGLSLGTGPWPAGRGGGGGGRGGTVADRPFRRNWTIPLAMSPTMMRIARTREPVRSPDHRWR